MITYEALQMDWSAVLNRVKCHMSLHSRSYYYSLRQRQLSDIIERAARFIYLNRTCWNGLYRVNLQGRFNVPPGTPREIGIEDNHFRDVSAVLQHAKLCNSDFQYLIEQADSGDLLFIDPSYTVRHSNNGFIRYNEALFSWNDQERLAACLIEAQSRGVHIIATNAPHESIKQLYAKHFKMLEVDRFSSISGKADSRRRYNELIILSSSSRQIDV